MQNKEMFFSSVKYGYVCISYKCKEIYSYLKYESNGFSFPNTTVWPCNRNMLQSRFSEKFLILCFPNATL